MGMAKYCSRFIPNLPTIAEPLRALTKTDGPWKWEKNEEEVFQKIKTALLSKTTTVYFDPKKHTELIVDTSLLSLGAVLTQEVEPGRWAPLASASKSLTPAEARYAQIEWETLAIKWACGHFHLYLCGRPFRMVTDHQPLVSLLRGTAPHPPPRIKRWAIQLQNYQMEVVYRQGSRNPLEIPGGRQ